MSAGSSGAPAPRLSAVAPAIWILAAIAVLFFLRAARDLLIPIALAALISYALEPAVVWLERRRVPRFAGATMVLLLAAGAIVWGLYSLRTGVTQAIDMVPEAAQKARQVLMPLLGATGATSGGGGFDSSRIVETIAGSVMTVAGNAVVVFFLVFFLLLSGHRVQDRLIEISGGDPERRRTTASIIRQINAQIQQYLLVLLFTAVVVGLATWGALAWMGVRQAAVWALLAGVFNSIPYFGPVIVSGGLFVVGLVQGGGVVQAAQMSGAAIVITSLEGWLLTPPLMGRAERMNALTVFIGLLLWSWLWGAWGTILAVPMLVIIKSVADQTERLRPVGRLMAP